MKSILYVGAALMIGASIYGFVDYKKSSTRKEFKKMYEPGPEPVVTKADEPAAVPAVVTTEEPAATEEKTVVKKETPKRVKKVRKQRKFRYSEFSRAPLREPVEVVESH